MALQCVLTGLQQDEPVAELLDRQSNIAFARTPIGTIVLSAVEKASGPLRGGFVSLHRKQTNQHTEINDIIRSAITYMCSFPSAHIRGLRMQIFEQSSFGHFGSRMLLNPTLDVFGTVSQLVSSPDNSPPFLQTNTSRTGLG